MKEKIREMEALAEKLGLTQQDLENWVVSRLAQQQGKELKTPLALVYKSDDELYLSLGLDLKNDDEVFGWLLSSGVVMRRIYPIEKDNTLDWEGTRRYVEGLIYNGKTGMMVDADFMQKSWTFEERLNVFKTISLLELNGIPCGNPDTAFCWCAEEKSPKRADSFVFYKNQTTVDDKNLAAEVIVLKF